MSTYTKKCKKCLIEFQTNAPRTTYCSVICKFGEAECEVCKTKFVPKKHTSGKFCSPACWYNKYDEQGRGWKSTMPVKPVLKRLTADDAVEPPSNAMELLQLFPEWTEEDGKVFYTSSQGHKISGYWKECLACKSPYPTTAFKRQKYCTLECHYKTNKQSNHPNWKGGDFITPEGYRRINVENKGRILEHRHVMEQHLGRKLLDHENVHHKDGNRANNDISNLELWSKSQPSGQRVKDKLEWARKILEEYKDL